MGLAAVAALLLTTGCNPGSTEQPVAPDSGITGTLTLTGFTSSGTSPVADSRVIITQGARQITLRKVTAGVPFSIPLKPGSYQVAGDSSDIKCQPIEASVAAHQFAPADLTCAIR
jgi:hypothetical protein